MGLHCSAWVVSSLVSWRGLYVHALPQLCFILSATRKPRPHIDSCRLSVQHFQSIVRDMMEAHAFNIIKTTSLKPAHPQRSKVWEGVHPPHSEISAKSSLTSHRALLSWGVLSLVAKSVKKRSKKAKWTLLKCFLELHLWPRCGRCSE